jgi:hypothetical protein
LNLPWKIKRFQEREVAKLFNTIPFTLLMAGSNEQLNPMDSIELRFINAIKDVKSDVHDVKSELKTELSNRFRWLENQFGALQETVEQISTRQEELEIKVNQLGSKVDDKLVEATEGVDKQINQLRDEMHETQRKMARMSNIVLFGVPERQEGLDLALSLMNLLVPEWTGNLDDDRIGADTAPKPRPLRIRLDNYSQKRKALSSKRKLASCPQYHGISVQPDMTKTEQQKKKATRMQFTREAQAKSGASTSRMGLKRKNTEQGEDAEQYKRLKAKDNNNRNTAPEEEDMLD